MAEPIQVPQSSDTKPGIKTTEFWLTLMTGLASLVGQIQGAIPAPWGTVTVAVVTAAYTIARAFLKR